MKNRINRFFYLLHRGPSAMGRTLARLCYRIKFTGVGISPTPGILTFNFSLRAGGSGPTHHSTWCKTSGFIIKNEIYYCFFYDIMSFLREVT